MLILNVVISKLPPVGRAEGAPLGTEQGTLLGLLEGASLATALGIMDGVELGIPLGAMDGWRDLEGLILGAGLLVGAGLSEGVADGASGPREGRLLGWSLGDNDGSILGILEGYRTEATCK